MSASTPVCGSKALPSAIRWAPTRCSLALNRPPVDLELGFEIPIAGGFERDALALAFDQHAHRDALHPAGAEAGPHPLPEQGREGIAVEAIEDPPRFLGPHQVFVDRAGMAQGLLDRFRSHLVEDDAADRHRLVGLQHLQDVPADAFSSRSSSVASSRWSASLSASLSRSTCFFLSSGTI